MTENVSLIWPRLTVLRGAGSPLQGCCVNEECKIM
jgi:hypothetical protein